MKIFPKNHHFKVTMYANATIGLWPLVCQGQPLLQKLYDIYAKFVLTVFIIFVTSSSVEVVRLATLDDLDLQEIFKNLCITLLDATILMKAFVIKTPKMVGLVREAIEIEDGVYKSGDGEILKIYDRNVLVTHRSCIIFIINYALVTGSYYILPLTSPTPTFDPVTNQTITVRPLPASVWVPWDDRQHYWPTFACHLYAGGVAACNVLFLDVFMFSLITIPLGQFDLLGHQLRNFKEYAEREQRRTRCSRETGGVLTVRRLAKRHEGVIRYVNDYNDEVKYVMVFDFLISSVQLAAIVIQLVGAKLEPLDYVLWGSFVMCMLMRLFMYYWFANEIMVKSTDLCSAIWQSEWYEEHQDVQKMMLIILVRSKKELSLNIGPFSTMTLQTFLGIMKAAYSYVMIMYK